MRGLVVLDQSVDCSHRSARTVGRRRVVGREIGRGWTNNSHWDAAGGRRVERRGHCSRSGRRCTIGAGGTGGETGRAGKEVLRRGRIARVGAGAQVERVGGEKDGQTPGGDRAIASSADTRKRLKGRREEGGGLQLLR